MKILKFILLAMPFLWYKEAEWNWSHEIDGIRKPRRFFRHHCFGTEYIITEVYNLKSERKCKITLLFLFIKEYIKKELIGDQCCLVYSFK